jgi:hypothetical protein
LPQGGLAHFDGGGCSICLAGRAVRGKLPITDAYSRQHQKLKTAAEAERSPAGAALVSRRVADVTANARSLPVLMYSIAAITVGKNPECYQLTFGTTFGSPPGVPGGGMTGVRPPPTGGTEMPGSTGAGGHITPFESESCSLKHDALSQGRRPRSPVPPDLQDRGRISRHVVAGNTSPAWRWPGISFACSQRQAGSA